MTVITKETFHCKDVYGKKDSLTVYKVETTSKKARNEIFYSLTSAIEYCKFFGLKYRRPQLYRV